jgi:hypothetical protein
MTFLETTVVTAPERKHSWIELLGEMQASLSDRTLEQVSSLNSVSCITVQLIVVFER